ncbi:acyl-CoA dehydrogenase family protein [Pendulispora albinea]|uniref:Acyl-CoA dehydrogenase family protein n=1 Tax=Pendulispora albinea TaxID=2741071 RepID=A0ABZ2LN71_9BACT
MSDAVQINPPEAGVTDEVMIRRAKEMIPTLRKRADEAERLRTLPPETFREFLDAGFYRILQPKRFGGYELGLPTFCEVMKTISRGCCSSGWVLCLTSAHTFHLAAFPEAGQVEIYGDTGDVRVPLIHTATGTAIPVQGGYRLSGRWNYNSGGEYATWVVLTAMVPGAGEGAPPKDLLMVVIRREDFEIVDNWHVMGMRGTGSKQALVQDVFVPERRAIPHRPWMLEGQAPGYGVHANPFYRTPPMGVFSSELASICVGLAEAAIDGFYERATTKVSPFPPFRKLSEDRWAHRRVGQARARLEVAEAMLQRIIANQLDLAKRVQGGDIDYIGEHRLAFMRIQQTMRQVRDCVECLFDISGTSVAQSGQPLERIYRDLTTIRTNFIMSDEERTAENWGACFFGLPPYSDF